MWALGERKEGFTRRMYASRLRRSASGVFIRWRCSHRAVGLLRNGGGQRATCCRQSSWLHLAQRPLKIGR